MAIPVMQRLPRTLRTGCTQPEENELLQLFQQANVEINAGTLYPLLNLMHKNGWLESNWVTPQETGHPRRHYQLSKAGTKLLPAMLAKNQQNQNTLKNLGKLT